MLPLPSRKRTAPAVMALQSMDEAQDMFAAMLGVGKPASAPARSAARRGAGAMAQKADSAPVVDALAVQELVVEEMAGEKVVLEEKCAGLAAECARLKAELTAAVAAETARACELTRAEARAGELSMELAEAETRIRAFVDLVEELEGKLARMGRKLAMSRRPGRKPFPAET